MLETAILVGLLYALFTIGLSISFRVLDYPDLTLEGSVIFGGALCFNALSAGLHPAIALFAGGIGGIVAGVFTATQHLYLGVSKLLSGIVTTAVLYSINIRLLGGRANVRFQEVQGLFDVVNPTGSRLITVLLLTFIVASVIAGCSIFFTTRIGLLMRTVGSNQSFVTSLGHNPKLITLIGLGLSNGIIGVGGAILVQYKQTVDVNMSFGLLIGALAALVLGETITSARTMWQHMIGSVQGTVLYNLAIALVLYSWSSDWESLVLASDVRLVTGLLLILPTVIKLCKIEQFRLFKSEW